MSGPAAAVADCVFCEIARGERAGWIVYENELSLAFLDQRPLFPGHTLLVPRAHHETLGELPESGVAPLFGAARLLARAVEQAMEAQGTFVAINNRVSQSVPHLHVHVVPRRRGDGLRGFFWPRKGYDGEPHKDAVRDAIRARVDALRAE